jgi:small subunit ribosomal protein S20
MANHKSSIKRIRQTKTRCLRNRYGAKTMRNALKVLRGTADRTEAETLYPKVCSMLDKLAKKNVIHKNKAGNLKSKLAKHIHALA